MGSETQYQSIDPKIRNQNDPLQNQKFRRRTTAINNNMRYNSFKESKEKPNMMASFGNMMFGINKALKESYREEISEFAIDPQTSDLSDLFNYDFNEPNSCLKEFKEGFPIT